MGVYEEISRRTSVLHEILRHDLNGILMQGHGFDGDS